MTVTITDKTETGLTSTVETLADGKQVSTWTSQTPSSRVYKYKDSVTTPGFRNWKRFNKARLPVNPYYVQFVKESRNRGQYTDTTTSGSTKTYVFKSGYCGFGSLGANLVLTPSEIASIDSALQTKLRMKIKDTKVNLWQVYAEREQVARMIGTNATRIAAAILALKKGNIGKAADYLGVKAGQRKSKRHARRRRRDQAKAIAQGWLELQYGWKPLLSDIYGACEELARTSNNEIRERVHGSTRVERTDERVIDEGGYRVFEQRALTYTVRYGVDFAISTGSLHKLSQIGALNPALIAWELLPWSFVVDWFIPIGDYISSFDATVGCTFKDGYKTTCEKTLVTRVISANALAIDAWTKRSGNWSNSKERTTIQRSKLSAFPAVTAPQLKNPISVTHMFNALSLLIVNTHQK